MSLKNLIADDLKKITTNLDEFAISATYKSETESLEISGIFEPANSRERNDYKSVNEFQYHFICSVDFIPKDGDYLVIDDKKYIITDVASEFGSYRLIIERNEVNYSHSHGRFR